MGLGIAGRLYLSCQIDGVEVPFGFASSLKVFINQNCKTMLPAIRLEAPDLASVFDKSLPVNDGSLLTVTLNNDQQASAGNVATGFRIIGTPLRRPLAQIMHYTMHGLLDALPFVRGNPPAPITGHSVDVAKQVAQAMNFKYAGTIGTDDNMTWLPGRKTWGTFLRHVVQHSWIGPNSAQTTAVDEQRQLHFADINDMFANKPIAARLVYGSSSINRLSTNIPTYACSHYRAINRGGISNNMLGYGWRMSQAMPDGSINEWQQNQAMSLNNVIDISKTVLGQLNGRARIDLPPIFTSNTHDNYLRARHQNNRTAAFYSQNLYVLIPFTTGLNLFDMVEFECITPNFTDYSTNGLYSITNMTRALINGSYFEKAELTNAGPNNSNSSLV